ncbi:hypothetical protein SAMN02745704_00102 [Paucidesulfovibrio gracilis DSM 16080]|uniref:Uncharacterized protein n=1 Tax=Paucidesulfovibrio gracilis DSM 16080 TaxID=1121449 RepID=A0A1T4W2E8_9BACT|nr:hypothetical protein [Paucidesulfovibrio gracilis]SKA71235.1 hypothetical protein SAMN02745704_00102 [Paucidesulfovibrio gracilis DSM 16080]
MEFKLSDLIREIRISIDYLIHLPNTLNQLISDFQCESHSRKERVRKQKIIVELREVGKSLIQVYIAKNDIYSSFEDWRYSASVEDIEVVKEQISYIIVCLDDIESALVETSFNTVESVVKALNHIKVCKNAYGRLLKIPNSEYLDGSVADVAYQRVKELSDAGVTFVKELDSQRKLLDYTY